MNWPFDLRQANRAERALERQLRQAERGRGAVHRQHVGIVLLVAASTLA